MDKALLDLEEFCTYLGIGKTQARKMLKAPKTPYTVRLGNRLYANKRLLDKWLDGISGN
ncbi:Helix-turn-helix domain-containing protein [Anaerocolumna jejuensis DSM 15929]|uniref:Helix-turn-helix domain-containing protein n=1 Tax=Anaerocolumna jejuensis DSM 15929 TaxID=1121322 RepID=A0A1M6KDV6_9FIRM|nr:helix-turn-helix domain-containing protein [Anaerocolumna jejuensis]SHJ57121.1 Helix-turn-helix domain-containing protein [Anaerocolumna jejuensis DSM 15929]